MMRRPRGLAQIAGILLTTSLAVAQGDPGHVNYVENAQASFDGYTYAPSWGLQQWLQNHFWGMIVYPPYFDTRTSWFWNAYAYFDLYGIQPWSWARYAHPEWILHDQWGNWLYIPFNCGGGTCAQYAGDISNPAFRAYWIANAASSINSGNYPALFVDDVNMAYRVSDGWGNWDQPIDSNTGQPMTYDAWRYYVAIFLEQIHGAFPNTKLVENAIWYAGPDGARDSDSSIQRQIATATTFNIERGIANDPGITGGTGPWSLSTLFGFIDRLHEAGKSVNFEEYWLDPGGMQYGLAGYFLVSNGYDTIGDSSTTPDNWWSGYDVELGAPLGPRVYSNGVFERDFASGKVLLGEPGLAPRAVNLGGYFQTLDGNWVNWVTISGWQGIVLRTTAPSSSWETARVSRYLSDLTPYYAVNGWGNPQTDVSVWGNPLTLNGVQYGKGLGVHAYSELRYALYGSCNYMTARVGIDSEVPTGVGNVDFQVWGDGTLLYDSGYLTGGSPRQSINVDLTGFQTLGLVVTNGIYLAPSSTTSDDHADWANAIVVCAQ